MKTKILVTGATGQIGSELTPVLRRRYGADNVIAAGHHTPPYPEITTTGPFYSFDIRDAAVLEQIIKDHRIGTVFHLAALLSAVAETKPQQAWDINMNGLLNILECARRHHYAVFFPSSIGAFGPETPSENTPQDTIQRPQSIYGITKVSGELLCDYYHRRHGVDTRGVRFPGLISYKTAPGGGTTDYAVEIFYAAVRGQPYPCFLKPDTRLDMMYMPDAISAMLNLMDADPRHLKHRNAFNITSMSFTPEQLASEIRKHLPEFNIRYQIDPVRQAIADSWPRHMDDSAAREEWGWRAEFDLPAMVHDMLEHVAAL
ncbi:MAG: L-threonine 3-dehydrogenase [Gammaproteobacteria bacterium]